MRFLRSFHSSIFNGMLLMGAFFRPGGGRRFLWVTVLASTAFAERVDLLRDDFWVAHIFASTPAGAAFASGYAQAEDRLEELMRNYRKAGGTMAEAFGPEWYRHDGPPRMWGHRRVARETSKDPSPPA